VSVFLELGQRPDEPGPPIHGAKTYPADVEARLAADAQKVIAKYPQGRSALLPLLHLVQSEDGCLTSAGIAFCAAQLGLTDAVTEAPAKVELEAVRPKLMELARQRAQAKSEGEKQKGKAAVEKAAKEAGAEQLPSGVVVRSCRASSRFPRSRRWPS